MSKLACPLRAAVVAMLLATLGCFGNEATEFPPGLEPVADNSAPLPVGSATDPYPQTLETVHGSENGTLFSHSHGYVHAEPDQVWAALKIPEVVADRRNTTRLAATLDAEPEYDYSFLLHYEVDDVITVEWDENWRYGSLKGSKEAPELGVIAFKKTFGTTFIRLLEGSMRIEVVEPGVVLFGLVEVLDAAMTDSSKPAGYQADVFANVIAVVNGEPLPQY